MTSTVTIDGWAFALRAAIVAPMHPREQSYPWQIFHASTPSWIHSLLLGTLLSASCTTEVPPEGETDGATASETSEDPSALAKTYFWEAFTEQRFADAPEATRLLELAYADDPSDAGNTLRLAHSYLWRYAELARNPAPNFAEVPGLAGNAERYFSEALALAPGDARIYGWLGPVKVGAGLALGDPAAAEAGYALLATGVDRYPAFNLFVLALVLGGQPRESPEFARALDAMWRNVEVCANTPIDRDAPDFQPLVDATLSGRVDHACTDTPLAAHNFEGFFLFFGDLLTKSGNVGAAQAAYATAGTIPNYSSWPYQGALLDHVEQVEARATAWANGDPSDDPRLVSEEPYACAYCHAAAAHEPLP